jgi:hypothetical protein
MAAAKEPADELIAIEKDEAVEPLSRFGRLRPQPRRSAIKSSLSG